MMETVLSSSSLPVAVILGALPIFLVILYIRLCYLPYRIFKKCGISGPEPSPFFGDYKEASRLGMVKYFRQITEKYGPIVGTYIGKRPVIITTDLELIKLVTVKDSEYFINRPEMINFSKKGERNLFVARDEEWKIARQTLSPSFSSLKLKAMTPLIQHSVNNLVEVLQEHMDGNSSSSLEFSRIFGSFTMETILATGFGRIIDIQKGESDKLTEAAAVIFEIFRKGGSNAGFQLVLMLSNFPWLNFLLRILPFETKPQKALSLLKEAAKRIIQERRKANTHGKYKDILQLMMEATVEDEGKTAEQKLTDEQITAHSVLFMLAGYETTANTLAFTAYLLALSPDVQEMVQMQIDSFFQKSTDASLYQAAQSIDILNMVVQETLRLYPATPFIVRQCSKDYKYKKVTIPKGCSVYCVSYLLQMDLAYWTEPEKFDPMRFAAEEMAKRPQLCYMPFGSGPRSCIGMRLALLEIKIVLIEVLRRFSFVKAPETQIPLETSVGLTMGPKNGVHLKLIARNN